MQTFGTEEWGKTDQLPKSRTKNVKKSSRHELRSNDKYTISHDPKIALKAGMASIFGTHTSLLIR